jgi:hypothetical protein
MPSLPLLTCGDLDEIGGAAFDAEDPRTVAAELVDAVEQGRVADQADVGYALMLAAEITERGGDLDAAVVLAERAVRVYQQDADRDDGYARSVRAGLRRRLGREDEGLAELDRLRRLLTRDTAAVSYVSEALEAGGRPEIAEQWLSAALETSRQRKSPGSREDPAYRSAAMMV